MKRTPKQSPKPDPSKLDPEARDAYEERCAIIEEGCKVSREESERLAWEQIMEDSDAD